jgi:hypothetical protein
VIKHLECEADHSYLSSAKVKNVWSFTSTPTTFLHGMVFRPKGNCILIETIIHMYTVARTFVHLSITDFHQVLV